MIDAKRMNLKGADHSNERKSDISWLWLVNDPDGQQHLERSGAVSQRAGRMSFSANICAGVSP